MTRWIGAWGAFWRWVCRRLRTTKDLPVDQGVVSNPSLLVSRPVKPNVDYSRFDRLLKDAEAEEAGLSVAVCGRKGSNKEAVNGVYLQDGTLNGCPRLKKTDGTRWLKFTDDQKWMISRYPDGRPLGEAYAEPSLDLRSDPKGIPGPWFVYSKDQSWEEDQLISVTPGNCAGCGKLLQRLQRCSQCRAVSYCDHSCQKGDWQFHKRLCSKRSWKLPDEGECYVVPENPDTEASRSKKDLETPDISAPRSFPQNGLSAAGQRPKVRSGQNWEERDLLGWSKQRLGILFEGPEEREGLPALRVLCRDGGRVEVTTVKEIDGLASVWPNQGDRRHLFDLSFQVVFKAFWLSDFSLMSMDGTVSFHDFTTDLVDSESSGSPFVCGMSVVFAPNSESPVDEPRTVMQTAMPPRSRAAIQEALGADAWTISRGEGLMHLVHLRLKHFAKEFEAQ